VNDRVLRYDREPDRTVLGDVGRVNLFSTVEHDLTDNLQLFTELGYYRADFKGQRETSAMLSTTRIAIPAANYWNPFGPTGSPNRLAGLTNVPATGLDLILRAYAPVDAGPRPYEVTDDSYRALTGLRWHGAGFEWESALLYSEAKTNDVTHNAVSNSLFQQALAKTTSDAYNPFNGGNLTNFSRGDSTPNSQATISPFLVDVHRVDKTSLALWDLKGNRPDLFRIWSGDIGIATGVEVRRETYKDDRDNRLDGTTTFTDMVTHVTYGSDIMGASGAPDVNAKRTISSAFLEFSVPLVSEDMGIPLVKEVNMQIAGRDEHYSDFGNVAKPKVALAWKVIDSLSFRTAWQQSFRAPNLPQFYSAGTSVSNTDTDWAACKANGIATTACIGTSTTTVRSGNQNLKAEDADNFSAGVVFQPTFIPSEFGVFTTTVDYWSIKETRVIGVFGDVNNLALDYLLRQRGSSNPAVVRNAPAAGQVIGDVLYVNDSYLNLNARKIEGLDFSFGYDLQNTPAGSFSLKVSAAKLLKFQQDPTGQLAVLLAAKASGELPANVVVNGVGNLIGQDGTPQWRGSAGLTWRLRGWGAGALVDYVGRYYDSGFVLTNADGTSTGKNLWYPSWTTVNLYAQKSFDGRGWLGGTNFRVGVRNVADHAPPLTTSNFGFNGELSNPLGRFVYAAISKQF
jgi:outer membrane receptor protein involved in Fe transport